MLTAACRRYFLNGLHIPQFTAGFRTPLVSETGEVALFRPASQLPGIEGDEVSRGFVHSTDRSGADVIRRTADVETCTVYLSFRFLPARALSKSKKANGPPIDSTSFECR